MLRSTLLKAGVLPLTFLLLGAQNTPPDLRKLGEHAYLFAYPLVLGIVTSQGMMQAVEANRFVHLTEFPDDKSRWVVRPNADTLYSVAGLDLSKEPVLLHVPDTHGRYYLAQVMDAWTEVVAAPGKRTTGTGEGWFAIVGPGWTGKLPELATRIDSPTNRTAVVLRIQTNTASDYAAVNALQRQFWFTSLSAYPSPPTAPPVMIARRQRTIPPSDAVAALSTAEFFDLFAQRLRDNPPHAVDADFMKQLAAVGIGAGKSFPAEELGAAFEQGVADAKIKLENSAKLYGQGRLGATGRSGWTMTSAGGRYGVDYDRRAVVARNGYGANLSADAVYPACGRDSTGALLDGVRAYVMHFDEAQLPPVRAFWSVTVYDASGYFVGNPINRYAIGDRDPLKYNADGSLDLYIQHKSPGPEQESNWLPTAPGPFTLQFRLYWPMDAVLNGQWTPPAVSPRRAGTT